jgi:FtsZ-binding cell division protein ZapB
MSDCAVCNTPLPSDGGFITCHTCKKDMHYGTSCSGLGERTWRAKSALDREAWLCKFCRPSRNTRFNSTEETPLSGDLQDGLTQIKESIEKFFSVQFETLNSKLDQTLNQLQLATREIEELKLSNSKLLEENSLLKEKAVFFEAEVGRLCQYTRSRNIELHGLPERQGENVDQIVMEVGRKLKVELASSEFIAHRLGRGNVDKPRPIIVQFDSRKKRDTVLKNGKSLKINANDVDSNFQNKPLYVNENLTPYFKKLFYEARKLKNVHNYRYLWIANSKILLKKHEDSRPIKITSERDLIGLA